MFAERDWKRLKENEGIEEEKEKKGRQTGFHAQPQNQEVENKTILYLVVGQFSPGRKFWVQHIKKWARELRDDIEFEGQVKTKEMSGFKRLPQKPLGWDCLADILQPDTFENPDETSWRSVPGCGFPGAHSWNPGKVYAPKL